MKQHFYHDRDHAFGQIILTLRSAMGMTQAELAKVLNVSSRAVGGWEAGVSYPKVERLKQFIALAVSHQAFHTGHEAEEIRTLWKAAHQKVLLDEKWLEQLLVSGASEENKRDVVSTRQATIKRNATSNLPVQAKSFVGRVTELSQIARILKNPACRLLTLIGPGGIGKTRLALEVAAHQAEVFVDGAAFVALASVGTTNQIVSAIGDALHLSFAGQTDPLEYLLGYLRERHLLLVLDNFEHLLNNAEWVNDILRHAPNVTLLVTSRSRLNLQAEWLFDVEGLSYPARDVPVTLQMLPYLAEYSAVKLFVQRAAQVQPQFSLSEMTLKSIINMSHQLAGLPLAIELAAAAMRTHSIDMIEQQICENLDVLSTTLRDIPERHRSMRAAFEHSWSLLSEPERTLFSRLAIFHGSFTAEAAKHVTGATLVNLGILIDKSLLRQSVEVNHASESRFMMLEPIREYALEQLTLREGVETLQRAHANFYIEISEAAEARWFTPKANEELKRLSLELNNLRAALQWACDSGSSTLGLQLAGILWHFWRVRGYIGEGRTWVTELLAQDETDLNPAAHDTRLRALYGAAMLAADQHDFAEAERLIEQRMDLLRAIGQSADEGSLRTNMALEARVSGEYQQATRLLEETLTRARTQNNRGTLARGGLGVSLYLLALVLREQGNFARAEMLLKECVDFHAEMGERTGVAQALLGLSDIARDQGQIVRARNYCERSLKIFREFGTQWAIGFGLNNLAQAAYLDGDLTQAFALTEESLARFRTLQADASLAEVLITSGHTLRAQGSLPEARQAFSEALQLAWIHGPRLIFVGAAEGLASVEVERGQMTQAVSLLGAASAARAQMGTPVRPADKPSLDQVRETSRTVIGDEAFEIIWAEAQRLALDEIVSEVVG